MPASGTLPSIPDHTVLRVIGCGSYGEIWLARGLTGAFRAVKVVYRETFESERSFAREFDGMSNFEPISRSHDGFVDILHVGRQAAFFYYIMELADDDVTGRPVPGSATDAELAAYQPRTLKAELDRRKQLPVSECLSLGASLAEALEDLHSHQLTHRDIKPANIIFVDGCPKLADIGLVASVGQRSYVGTEGYVPPEGPGSGAADIYSLGKVLYEIAMGKDRMDFPELSTALDRQPEKRRLLALNQVLLKACATDPAVRYRHARAMHADLLALGAGRVPARRRRFPWGFALLVIVLLGACLAGGYYFRANEHRAAISDLRIETDPPGAMVIFGDRMEKSPAVFESVQAGDYPLQIMLPGYEPISGRVDAPSEVAIFRLTRSVGDLKIAADPPAGATYQLLQGGKPIRAGALPAQLTGLPTGDYEIVASAAGHTTRQGVKVDRDTNAAATLVFAMGHVSIVSDPRGAEIFADGASVGEAPMELDLPTGPHDVFARYRSWPDVHQAIDVTRTNNSPVEFTFRNGSVKITSAPGGAQVMRNGMELGRTPLLVDEIEPGPVAYELRLDGYKSAMVSGTVAPREQAFLAARLDKQRSPEPGKPWTNSIGMKFVPDGAIYFGVWDTRVCDYDAYCDAAGATRRKPDFDQTPNDPVVFVSWTDAEAFCKWLTQKEIAEGTLEEGQFYRLPTDAEWSAADGLPPEGGATPEERDGKMRGIYPWGSQWPPPPGSGNFADKSARHREQTVDAYNDGWTATSPAGSFPPNRMGLYDMSGNVWQWIEDGYRERPEDPRDWGVLRGGSWGTGSRAELESGYRNVVDRNDRDNIYGFRVVLVSGG